MRVRPRAPGRRAGAAPGPRAPGAPCRRSRTGTPPPGGVPGATRRTRPRPRRGRARCAHPTARPAAAPLPVPTHRGGRRPDDQAEEGISRFEQ
ncbi:hypothetical protein DEF28_19470 [Marinitenerispora sediminis]|uniref:Uncharacterized protein n=1 Tax=Marinitenerispora sediminis TaxID=1931232 RepID=A0A368T9Q5_9ACTN|nr:hypothetical protein DEF28_19470 [Marinitenerispora sediminis]RCV61431.1 hypothetical protein DEF24_04330 [Marinitenerispora sediminis]